MIGRAASADVERLLTMDPFDRFNRVRVDEWEEWVMDYLARHLRPSDGSGEPLWGVSQSSKVIQRPCGSRESEGQIVIDGHTSHSDQSHEAADTNMELSSLRA
jgi:hypothetical protein